MSKYTAFVAIDDSRVVAPGGDPRRVDVPVDLPEGMSHQGIGGEAEYAAEPSASPPMAPGAMADDFRSERVARRERPSASDIAQRRLERAIKRRRRALDKCFASAKKRGWAAVALSLEVGIDAAGTIRSVTLTSLSDASLRRCLAQEIETWTIRRPGETTIWVSVVLPPPS
jgi:hypothetical protein